MNGINDVVIVALIGLAGTVITASAAIICQIIINKKNNAKLRADELEKERIRAADAATKEEHNLRQYIHRRCGKNINALAIRSCFVYQ